MSKKNKNRLLIITQPDVTNTVGGAITVFVNFCNMLANNKYEVYATCYNEILGTPSNLNNNVNFSNLYSEYQNLDFSRAVNKKVREVKPNLIIFFFPFLYIDANLSEEFNYIPRILMFHSRPDFYFAIHPNSEKKLEPLYINTTAQVIFNNFKDLLPKFIKDKTVITIPNGISLSENKAKLDIEHKKIIYLSRIDCWKGLEFLIYSFKKIASKYNDWQIHIYGQSQPPNYIEQLIELTQKLKIDKQIIFKGITSNPSKVFKQYDFCVFPSYFEGFGMGLAEAQIAGLPSIGLRECSGVNNLIIDGYNGYLSNENYDDFAKQIEKLILDKNKRMEFSKNAILEASKYDIEIINKKWIDCIEKIINGDYANLSKGDKICNNIKIFPIKKIIKMMNPNKLKWYQKIFSIKNSPLKTHKIITILGLKISIKNKLNK